MKNRLLQLTISSLKFSCYIFIIQVVFMTSLIASNVNAQYKSVKQMYINANFDNATVVDVFKNIEAQTDFKFHYFQKHIKKNVKLTFNTDQITVAELLYKISDIADIKFLQLNNNIAVSTMKRPTENALAVVEVATISGKVTDETGAGLPGVNVVVKGTTQGTITDVDGLYNLDVPEGTSLIFSFIGFKTQEVEVGTRTTIDIQMAADFETLSEVIVTAYGTSTKGAFTGSATQINSEALVGRSVTNISAAIEGAPGIQFSPGNGQPGTSSGIRVRGIGSVSAGSAPLYVLDGIQFYGSLSSINPNDIESITVLKDAASTALYGAKAANGVVLLTTKKGSVKRSKFNINISQGTSSRAISEYDRVDAKQYYPLLWESYRNSLSISGTTDEATANQMASDGIVKLLGVNPFNVLDDQVVLPDGTLNPSAQLLYADDLDWQDQLTRGGSRSAVDLSYQGGTENTTYFTSFGYLNDNGWILNSDFERIAGRLNVTTQPKKWVKTGLNLSATTSTSNQANDGGSTSFVNPFFSTRNIAPIYPVFEHDPTTGDFILDGAGNQIYDLGANRIGNTNGRHAIQETILNQDLDKIFSIGARTFIDINFLNNFKFTFNASLDKRFFNTEDFGNPIVGDGAPGGRAGRTNRTRTVVAYNQLLNYTKDFDNHSISVLIGHESQDYQNSFVVGRRTEQIAEGNTELGNFTTTSSLDSRADQYTNEGYLSRVEYDYDDKYFISASFRRDGSSKFAENLRRGNFWSVGGAWRADQESFLQNLSWINLLKLRASYGEVGNDGNINAIGFFTSQSLLALGNNNASESGILVESLAATNLKWESNNQFDVATEFELFNNRVSGSIEYYNRETDGLIFEKPLPLSSGVDDIDENVGAMSNKGFEINLSGNVLKRGDFTWRLSVNTSTLKNEFSKLPQDEIITGTKKLVVGGSIYDYFLRDWYGVDPKDGAALYVFDPEEDPTDVSVRTVDGILVTTDQNLALRDFVGTAIPDFFGSFTNTFSYKNFNLGFLFTYQIGGETYDTNFANLMSSGNYGASLSTEILNRWQKPGDITNVPRLDVAQTAAFGAGSDRWLVSSSYISLRQINISYDLPQKYIDIVGLSSVKIYANGENLFLSTKRKGMDVNQNFNGTTQNRFTPSRILTLGLNVTF